MVSTEHTTAALAALRNAGLVLNDIAWDAGMQRCGTESKPHGQDGCYVAHSDAPARVWWKNWRTGESGTWTDKQQGKLSPAEREVYARHIEETRQAEKAVIAARHAEAATKAKYIYNSALDCTGHDYLRDKGVKPCAGLRKSKEPKYTSLMVPVLNEQCQIVGLQFIQPNGEKRFLTGTAKTGAFFTIGEKDTEKPLLICEGLATGLSLHECLGYQVLVAFDCGNMKPVAELVRRRYPERELVLCADNDSETDGNPGIKHATAAALAVNGFIAVPQCEVQK